MKVRKFLGCLAMLCVLGLSVPVYADEGENADDRMSKMQTELNLTPAQVDAIKPILQQNQAKRDELWKSLHDQGADRDAVKSQMEQIKQDEDQQLGKILSSDQMTKLNTMRSEHKGMGMHHHHHEDGGAESK